MKPENPINFSMQDMGKWEVTPFRARVWRCMGAAQWNFPPLEEAQPGDIIGMMSHHTARFFDSTGLERHLEGFLVSKDDEVVFSCYANLPEGGLKERAARFALEHLYMAEHVHGDVVRYKMTAKNDYDDYRICVVIFARARVLFDMAMIDDPDSIREDAEDCPMPWSCIIELYDLDDDTPVIPKAERYLEIVRSILPLQQRALWPSLDIKG
ncbi:hypothetical protein [Limimaricola sp. AA108-03]|uniref:hypothetical protein n=1 Tax=Limimaricola sp. AA108-03 TaxID=3425945 RepID=UPI003D77A8BB